MRFFLDTEFNGFKGELISIALVGDDGSEWYKILDYDKDRVVAWVEQNVVPVLNAHSGGMQSRSKLTNVQLSLQAFLGQYHAEHNYIIVDWPDDIKHFCDLMVFAPGKRLTTSDLTFQLMYGMGDTAQHSAVPHNALEDARALRAMYHRKYPDPSPYQNPP